MCWESSCNNNRRKKKKKKEFILATPAPIMGAGRDPKQGPVGERPDMRQRKSGIGNERILKERARVEESWSESRRESPTESVA